MVSQEDIKKAKQSHLPNRLNHLGVDIKYQANSYCLREHESLKFFLCNDIWLYKWWSKGGEVGDGIQYLQRYHHMMFSEAVETLCNKKVIETMILNPDCISHCVKANHWMSYSWQCSSKKLVRVAQKNLFKKENRSRFTYLETERGLSCHTIKKSQLGWLPEKNSMPSKLLIPCYNMKGMLIRIRFRIDNPSKKTERYRLRKGSNAHLPYSLDVASDSPLIIIESELDALLIHQETTIGVIALGSTAIELTDKMITYLNKKIPCTLICLDNDKSGQTKTNQFLSLLNNAFNWPIPEQYGKDPGEAWEKMDLKAWIKKGLEQSKINYRKQR